MIREQNASTVTDALRNVAGVTFRAGEGGNQGDTPYIRGFSAQNDIFRDGVRDPGWYTRDTFAIDAVEVYKGPSSVLFGRGSTGGVDQPDHQDAERPQLRRRRRSPATPAPASAPRSMPTARSTKTSRRASSAMGQRYDIAGRDHVEENRWGVAPSLKFKLSDQTTDTTLSYIYQHDNNVPDYGIPFLSPAWGIPRVSSRRSPRSNWYGILSGPLAGYRTSRRAHRDARRSSTSSTTTSRSPTPRATRTSTGFQRNVFPEPNASVPPPPNLNATGRRTARRSTSPTRMLGEPDRRAREVQHRALEHTMATGFDITARSRDFSRNSFAGHGADQLPQSRSVALPAASRWRPTAEPVDLRRSEQHRRLCRRPDQDQPSTSNCSAASATTSYEFEQDAPRRAARRQQPRAAPTTCSAGASAACSIPTPNSSIYVMHGTSFNPSADNLTIASPTPPRR